MKLREVFNKIESYNEIAEMMGTDKAQIVLVDHYDPNGFFTSVEGHFKTYKELRKFVKSEYQTEVADKLLKATDWEIDGEPISFQWAAGACYYGIELAAI